MTRRIVGQWLQLLAAIALSVLAALGALGGLLQAAGHGDSRHDSRVGAVVLAIVFLVIVVIAVRWAMHAEHGIRENDLRSPAHSLPPPPGLRWRRRRRYSPVVLALVVLEFVGGFVGCMIAAPVLHGEWTRTERVQADGIRAFGTVTAVHNTRHRSKSSTWYTATIAIRLNGSVDGHTSTTAHFPHATGLVPGNDVRVQLDPRDPGYAEFPGYPSTHEGGWIVVLVMGVAFGVFDGVIIWSLVRQLRHRARVRIGD